MKISWQLQCENWLRADVVIEAMNIAWQTAAGFVRRVTMLPVRRVISDYVPAL